MKRVIALMGLLCVATALAQVGGGYDLTWTTIDGGGVTFSSGGGYELGLTIGQPDAGVATGGGYEFIGGFWIAALKGQADCNGNGTADATDIAAGNSQDCNANATPDECEAFSVIYVNDDAGGANNGSTWGNAFTNLQSALAQAQPGDQIWVADGIYRPSTSGNRSASFVLETCVKLYGGFDGTETTLEDRAKYFDACILSGDLNGDDDPGDAFDAALIDDNSIHVVSADIVGASAVLDGFTVSAGNASPSQRGGGLRSIQSSPTVRHCVFKLNSAQSNGGAVSIQGGSPRISYCRFIGNQSWAHGGGLSTETANLVLSNCHFQGNEAQWGSALISSTSLASQRIDLANCVLIGNIASKSGAAVMSGAEGSAFIMNCTIAMNSVDPGGTGWGGLVIPVGDQGQPGIDAEVRNSILWGNSGPGGDEQIAITTNHLTVRSSCIMRQAAGIYDPYDAVTTIDLDCPFGAVPGSQSCIWGLPPKLTLDGHLECDSPYIDAGDGLPLPSDAADLDGDGNLNEPLPLDLDGESRQSGARVDLGADEYVDTDGNCLPDWWEMRYFGVPTGTDPDFDSDGDCVKNSAEYHGARDPASPPIYVCDGCDPTPDGTPAHPWGTIQDGIDHAPSKGTVMVLTGGNPVYSGSRNSNLNFLGGSVMVRAISAPLACQPPAIATMDCGNATRAVDPDSVAGGAPALQGFRIINGTADLGGAIKVASLLQISNCVLADSAATQEGGGLYAASAFDVAGIRLEANSAPVGTNGLISSAVNLEGDLVVSDEILRVRGGVFTGRGAVHLDPDATLIFADALGSRSTFYGDGNFNTMPEEQTRVTGIGNIHIALGNELVLENLAILDLSGGDLNSNGCNGDCPGSNSSAWGLVTVDGSLMVTNATVQNTRVEVKLAGIHGSTQIVNNDLRLKQSSANFGGQFFVEGASTIACNRIESEGDRYLDLDPNPNPIPFVERPRICKNEFRVIIKQGVGLKQGELLELRSPDLNDNIGGGASGAYFLDRNDIGYGDTWALEELRIKEDAKVNLTNRQGFDFNPPETNLQDAIYVKDLVLGPNGVLNTGLQRLYYDRLIDSNGVALTRDPENPSAPMENESRILDVPVLGFSLIAIRMEDPTEFDVRVQKRERGPETEQPCTCPGIKPCDPPMPEDPATCRQGKIERITPTGAGVMEMRTHDPSFDSASSVSATGSFARAGEAEVVVAFEYLFQEAPPGTELIVFLSNLPTASAAPCDTPTPCDEAERREVARVRVPAAGRDGAAAGPPLNGTGEFATFYGRFAHDGLDFHRGSFVELELHGADARIWIDDWDPQIDCTGGCGDLNGSSGIEGADYLILASTYGTDARAEDERCLNDEPCQQYAGCLDQVFGGDQYVDWSDLLAWDAVLSDPNNIRPNACNNPTGRAANETVIDATPPGSTPTSVSVPTENLLIAGKLGASPQGDGLFGVTTSAVQGGVQSPPPSLQNRGNGRLVHNPAAGLLYQIHATRGVSRLTNGIVELGSGFQTEGTDTVHLGTSAGIHCTGRPFPAPFMDAAFHPTNPNWVYVTPVVVAPAGGLLNYKAAAKIELQGGGAYDIKQIYVPPANSAAVCGEIPNADYGQLRELETSRDGSKVFVASSQAVGNNDYILVYNEGGTPASPPHYLLSSVLAVSGFELKAPSNLLIARLGSTPYLYMTSGLPVFSSGSDSRTRVFRFDVTSGMTFAGAIDISNPACNNEHNFGGGCLSIITALAEQPDGTIWVTGFTAARVPQDLSICNMSTCPGCVECQLFGPSADLDMSPTLAWIPPTGVTWSTSAPTPPSPQITNTQTISGTLALPLSMVWNSGAPAATVTSLTSRKVNPAGPGGNCNATDSTSPFKVTEPHQAGTGGMNKNEFRVGFTVAPGGGGTGWTLQEATCAAPAFVASPAQATGVGSVVGSELVIVFTPALPNAKTYRVNLGSTITSIAGQSVDVRVLAGDATASGGVDAADRSAVVGVWTGSHFSCSTDINNSGLTDAADRSAVVGAWTSPAANCAP